MDSESEKSFLEKRQDERVVSKLEVSFQRLTEEELRADLDSGNYKEVFVGENLSQPNVDQAEREVGAGKAFTENISVSGIKLVGDLRLTGGEPLDNGMPLRVSIQIPDANQAISTIARVVWSTPASENGKFTAGLFFEGINRLDAERVARFLILQKRAQMGR